MPKIVVEKFSFSELKIDKVKFFTQSPTKSFCIGIFNVWGCLASYLIFRPFLRMHKFSTVLETSNKSVWSNFFWHVKVWVYSENIFNTLYMKVKQILKKFPSDKINDTKNALFFVSRASAHHNFIFNLRFLYELKHKICLSKTVCGNFHFRFCLIFIKVYIFVQKNAWTL